MGEIADSYIDNKIRGYWKYSSKKRNGVLVIEPLDDKWYSITTLEQKGVAFTKFFTTKFDNKSFMNLEEHSIGFIEIKKSLSTTRLKKAKGSSHGYLIFRYQLNREKELKVTNLDLGAIKRAINQGKTAGELKGNCSEKPVVGQKKQNMFKGCNIIITPGDLKRFVLSNIDLSFPERKSHILERINFDKQK